MGSEIPNHSMIPLLGKKKKKELVWPEAWAGVAPSGDGNAAPAASWELWESSPCSHPREIKHQNDPNKLQ